MSKAEFLKISGARRTTFENQSAADVAE